MSSSAEVEAWFARYDNPQKALVLATRSVCLDADPRIQECIKWQAPTFIYKGNIASFFPRAKAHVSLMFHTGATIPGHFPSLEGEGTDGRVLKIRDAADLAAKTAELRAILRAWCDLKDGK